MTAVLDVNRYTIMTSELGFCTSEDSFGLLDIAISEKEKFKFGGGYTKIPLKVFIEVDTKADLRDYTFWIFTKTKKVMVAERGKKWMVQDFEVFEGIRLNIEKLLKNRV